MIDQVKYPLITEKYLLLIEEDKYTFEVDENLTKKDVKNFVEKTFDVKVKKVNAHLLPKKKKRRGFITGWRNRRKRVIVSLQKGDIINLFS